MITEEIVNLFKNKETLDETINEKAMNSQLSKTDINNSLEQISSLLSKLNDEDKNNAVSSINTITKDKNNSDILDALIEITPKCSEKTTEHSKQSEAQQSEAQKEQQSDLQKENAELQRKIQLLTTDNAENKAQTITPTSPTLTTQNTQLPPIRAKDLAWVTTMMSINNPLRKGEQFFARYKDYYKNLGI